MNKKSLPDFDSRGNMPDGCFHCSLIEFKERFVDSFTESYTRKSRFEGFLNFIKYISKNINSSKYKLIVDGSFITTKINPNDIDFLIVFEYSKLSEKEYDFVENEYEKQENLLIKRDFHFKLVKMGLMDLNNVYCCDWSPLYKREYMDNKYLKYLKLKNFYLDLWGNTQSDENGLYYPKGMIILEIDSNIIEGFL